MLIRKATREDAVDLANLIFFAMEEIVYSFIGAKDENEAKFFLLQFTSDTKNQYSWENCWVAEQDGQIVGAVNLYSGAALSQLRQPILDFIRQEYGREIFPEDETAAGEFYIDTIAVYPDQRGKGIGSNLLKFIICEFVLHKQLVLGLLVDESNGHARKLYLSMGFKPAGKREFLGKKMEHLQRRG